MTKPTPPNWAQMLGVLFTSLIMIGGGLTTFISIVREWESIENRISTLESSKTYITEYKAQKNKDDETQDKKINELFTHQNNLRLEIERAKNHDH